MLRLYSCYFLKLWSTRINHTPHFQSPYARFIFSFTMSVHHFGNETELCFRFQYIQCMAQSALKRNLLKLLIWGVVNPLIYSTESTLSKGKMLLLPLLRNLEKPVALLFNDDRWLSYLKSNNQPFQPCCFTTCSVGNFIQKPPDPPCGWHKTFLSSVYCTVHEDVR